MHLDAHKAAVATAYGLASGGYNKPVLKFFSQGAEALVDFAGLARAQQILDVAAGTGHAALYAGTKVGAAHGSVIGIDIAEEMVNLANTSALTLSRHNVRFELMDGEHTTFADETFDAVLCSYGIFFAVAQKSPCTCSLEHRPLLTQLIELRLGLSQGSALHAEPLAMCSKALPFLSQVLRGSVAHRIEYLRLCWGPRQEFPGALALQRALREALLARGPQQAALRIAEAAFEFVVGPRQARHVIAVEQARPIAPADLVEMQPKLI